MLAINLIALSGSFSSRPAVGFNTQDQFYFATDTSALYYSDGTTWLTIGVLSSSYASTASYTLTSVSASYAPQNNSFTSSYLTTSSFNTFTSSVEGLAGFNQFTSSVVTTSSFNQFTSSVVNTSSFNTFTASVTTLSASIATTDTNQGLLVTGLLAATASYETLTTHNTYTASVSSSYVPNSVTSSMTVASASVAISSSYALSASYSPSPIITQTWVTGNAVGPFFTSSYNVTTVTTGQVAEAVAAIINALKANKIITP